MTDSKGNKVTWGAREWAAIIGTASLLLFNTGHAVMTAGRYTEKVDSNSRAIADHERRIGNAERILKIPALPPLQFNAEGG